MSKLGRITLVYFVIGIVLSSLVSYWDYHRLSSGSDFNQLNGVQRNSMRVTAIVLSIGNPVSIVATPVFVSGKPRNHKTARLLIVLISSLVPSYLFWNVIFRKKRRIKTRNDLED